MSKILPQSISDQVFRRLVDDIVSGMLKPGEQLPNQRKLAQQFGVNMGPLREALKKLEQLDLIDVRHGRSMVVKEWRDHGTMQLFGYIAFKPDGIDNNAVRSFLETNREILASVARLCAKECKASDIKRLRSLLNQMKPGDSKDSLQNLQSDFERALVEICDNIFLQLMDNFSRSLLNQSPELFSSAYVMSPASLKLLDKLVDAIEAHDQKKAAQCLEGWVDQRADQVMKAIGASAVMWED